MLRTTSLRVLGPRDVEAALALVDRDPVTNVFVGARLHAAGLDTWRLGAEVWGHVVDGELDALCYAGANLVPVEAGPEAVRAFAERARRLGRRCSSIVGPRDAVEPLWALLEPEWGPARDVRRDQPLLSISSAPLVAPDPDVRLVRRDEIDVLLPACIDMFTEEVGVSPLAGDGGALYRARVAELIAAGRAMARIDGGRVVFKAEVGAAVPGACQVQGVWVDPALRGRGHSVAGMAAVVELARADVAPVVSLYVNDYNTPARRAYERVGFRQVGTFMSVLF
ncbi:GNAT family N-acetyltransferase [Motilibacter aurantiacus]|uniref:GNAT family N-acetyltransferase n=1 Tax=Motilibacter aurantiacus TaxID=2714955 RepID=UPI001407ED91|nr:GNAT family N-acetyltransferase [Motilibacter aurantiacus]